MASKRKVIKADPKLPAPVPVPEPVIKSFKIINQILKEQARRVSELEKRVEELEFVRECATCPRY